MSADRHFDDPAVRHEFPHPLAALSDSTERWDRTGKFRRYRKIAALRD